MYNFNVWIWSYQSINQGPDQDLAWGNNFADDAGFQYPAAGVAGSQTGGKVAEQKVGFITGSQGSRHWDQGSSPADNLLILPAPAHSTTHHLSLANNKVTAFKRFHFTRRPNGFLLPCWCSLNVKIFFHDFVQVGQSLLVSRPPPSLVSSKLRHFSLFVFSLNAMRGKRALVRVGRCTCSGSDDSTRKERRSNKN